jgi:capsular exopolysaccharide synthesis family protein
MAEDTTGMPRTPDAAKDAPDSPLSQLVAEIGHPRASASRAPVIEELSAVVPKVPVPALQAVQTPGSVLGEELRYLQAKVWNIVQERSLKSVAMISAGPSEGKSTLSLGLAATMAQGPNRRILLVEADLRRPSLEAYLGLPRTAGLAEWLAGTSGTLGVRRVGPRGFFLLSAGCLPLEQPELLGSQRMEAVLQAARQTFDLIILDCPPLIPVADAILLQEMVDGFLCVVRARHTPKDMLKRALAHVKPDRVLGVVLNNHHEIFSRYQRNAYRTYGLRDRS